MEVWICHFESSYEGSVAESAEVAYRVLYHYLQTEVFTSYFKPSKEQLEFAYSTLRRNYFEDSDCFQSSLDRDGYDICCWAEKVKVVEMKDFE